ncbi:hypothetical protein SELMODRAFT_427616 [Selaginella moellendorffii]|uniref:Uncharacterized protein n=1 Tax=Selaginella moellendorffii TaxID=88036 RepID=D8T065_SELML|nr:hypothetical protein SELMODRAFT_427616 [Selaginella moellendorffii]
MASSAEPMEVDDPVSGLSREIREVERQIAVVEGQITAVEGQIKPVKSVLTVANIDSLLDRFWHELRKPNLQYPKADAFLADFPTCKVPLPKDPTDECPCLLWFALNQPFEASKRIIEVTDKAQPTLTVLFNVSGSGKTRTLYEIAVAQRGLFFVGVCETGIGAEGSGDLKLVASKLLELYPTGDIPEVSAAICLKALLISRFYLLGQVEKMGYLTGQAWLFKQVAIPLLQHFYNFKDPFKALTIRLLNLIRTEKDLERIEGQFQGVLDRLKGNWDGPIIFDECQIINCWLEKRFSPSTLGCSSRSFLDILVPALIDCGFRQFYYAGTGGSMLAVARGISATLKRRASVMVFHGFGGFTTVEDFKLYAGKLLRSVDGIDMQRVCDLYKGRYRFFVTALEHFIGSKRPLEQATEFLIDFFEKICTSSKISCSLAGEGVPNKSELEVYMDKTVLTDVEQFFERTRNAAAVKELKVILYHQVFGSISTALNINNPSLSLVEFGLAWLNRGNSVALDDLDKFFAKQDRDTWIKLQEPAVVRALFHYFRSRPTVFDEFCQQQFKAKGQGSDVTVGLEFERQAGLMVADALDGKAPVDFVSHFLQNRSVELRNNNFEVPAIYFEKAKVVKARVATGVVTEMCGKSHTHGTDCYTLEKYLNDVEGQADAFPTVLWTGDGGWGAFRPDALLFLTNDYESERRLIPCLLQMKSGDDVATQGEISSALDSLDLMNCRKKKDGGLNRLRDLASKNGLLRLAVLPHTVKDLEQFGFNYFAGQLPSGGRFSPLKRQNVEGAIQPLCGVIGGNNVSLYLKEWLIDSVWVLKATI